MALTEFERINKPRVDKVLKMLVTIEKSRKSTKTSLEEWSKLLHPVPTKFKPPETNQPKTDITATSPVKREMENLEKLSTTQLVDRMIACGAVLAERRK